MKNTNRATENVAAPVAGELTLDQIYDTLGIDDLHRYADDGTLPLEIPEGLRPPEGYEPGDGDQLVAIDYTTGRGLYALMSLSDDCLPAGSTGWAIRDIVDHLDIGALDWETGETIATYTACCYGDDGTEPGQIDVRLESAERHGLTLYRWQDHDEAGCYDAGDPTLDRAAAIEAGKIHAEASDETPDLDLLIASIIDTGYFGGATKDKIRAVCQAATEYSQGYLLLARGALPGVIGNAWTTNGYLQCEHIQLPATHSRIEFAADALLRAIETAANRESD